MIKYYLIGYWMGSFRTESETVTLEEFNEWANKYNPTADQEGIWRFPDGGRIVFEEIEADSFKALGNPKIGI
jgi:hypothetical protein